MKLLHKGLLLISVPLAFELFFAFGFASLLKRSTDQLHAEVHAKKVITKAELLQVLLSESSILVGLKANGKLGEVEAKYLEIWKEIGETYRALKQMASGAKYARTVDGVKDQLKQIRGYQKLAWLGRSSEAAIPPDPLAAEQFSNLLVNHFIDWYRNRVAFEASAPLGKLIKMELRSVKQGPELHAEISRQFKSFLLFGVLADLLMLAGLGIFFGKSIERRLRSLMETTRRLAGAEDLLPPIQGTDELAKLDLLLHYTASRIIETQRFKKQLLGVVCHELKAPLSAVQILLSLVSEDGEELNEKSISTVQRAKRNCNRLQLMVTELLELESMNAEKIKIKYAQVSLYELLETAAEMVKAFASDQEVEIVLECGQELATIDADRMVQVLVNLLSNAIKFSPKGSQVVLAAEVSAADLELSVTDQGPGIPEDLQEKLFEAFCQGEQPKESKIKGTGMGLAISKSIVQAHGGRIKIVSKPGEGASFRLKLPLNGKVETQGALAVTEGSSNIAKLGERKQFPIRNKGMILIGVPLLTEMIMIGLLAGLLQQADVQLEKQSLARRVISESQQVISEMADAAILVLICRGRDETNQLYRSQRSTTENVINKFMLTCSSDPKRRAAAEAIKQTTGKIEKIHRTILDESSKRVLTLENVGESLIRSYLDAWKEFSKEVYTIAHLEEGSEENEGRILESIGDNLDKLIVLGLFVNVLSAIALTFFLVQNINKRILRVQQNAERILNKEALLPPVTGTDEIAQLDKAFHAAATSLEQEQHIKKKLLAIASHELRSPLSAIMMSLVMLREGTFGGVSEKNDKRLAQAESGCERLIALINDILDIEKMEAGKFELVKEKLQIRPLVARSIACVQPIAEKKEISIGNMVDDCIVSADSERLVQVLINLLSNAIKFSDDGQSVKVLSSLSSDEFVIIRIEDKGKGINKEMQAKIFENFVSSASRENTGGTGLGLPISKAIIEQHGGRIECESIEGQGSAFWFSLPLEASN